MTESLPPVVGTQPVKDQSGMAIASLVLGLLSLCAWLLPICGGLIAVIGIVLGVLGMKSSKKNMAIAGIVLAGIGMLLTLINAVAGALLTPMLGGFDVNNMINQFVP
jgi:uncharacterized membrane protein